MILVSFYFFSFHSFVDNTVVHFVLPIVEYREYSKIIIVIRNEIFIMIMYVNNNLMTNE